MNFTAGARTGLPRVIEHVRLLRLINLLVEPTLFLKGDYRCFPPAVGLGVNVVQGDNELLFGLDMIRFLRIDLDPLRNQCWQWNKDFTQRRMLPHAQVEGSGLLAIRIDNWEGTMKESARRHGLHPMVRRYDKDVLRDQFPCDIVGEEDEKQIPCQIEYEMGNGEFYSHTSCRKASKQNGT